MGIKIVQKANSKPVKEETMHKKAVITILGTVGGMCDKENLSKGIYKPETKKARYRSSVASIKETDAINTLPILIRTFQGTHDIYTIHTTCARDIQKKVLENENLSFTLDNKYEIQDDKNYDAVFKRIDDALNQKDVDEIIVDVSHGFRHLPILMIVDLIIQNFKDTQKIKHILYAKEIQPFKEYEIIDLKEYLDLANITFILSTFEQNYTVANHIQSQKYASLIDALNSFSNDIMALNLNNLFKTSGKTLIEALSQVNNPSIESQATKLKEAIEELIDYKGKKRYQTYYDLAKDLAHKNYMLLSLSLLFESVRLYIKTSIKKEHTLVVEEVEKKFNGDLYKIGDFFKNLSWKDYEKFQKESKKIDISEKDYEILRKAYPRLIEELYKKIDRKRNNLAHANTSGTFKDIKNEINELLTEYENLCIKEKSMDDLKKPF